MLTPFDFQIEAIELGANRNALIADECGMGKTLETIEAAKKVRTKFPKKPTLVITLKKARLDWQKKIFAQCPDDDVIVVGSDEPLSNPKSFSGWVVTHYEALGSQRVLHQFSKMYWCCIIADEAHKMKNRRAQRTKNVKLIPGFRKLAATATPWDKNAGDLWSILHWLYPRKYHSYWDFVNKHVEVEEGFFGNSLGKVRNYEALAHELHRFFIQRTKREVRKDMPALLEDDIPVDMGVRQSLAYLQVETAPDIMMPADGDLFSGDLLLKNALSVFTKLRQISVDPSLVGVNAPSGKLEWLGEWLTSNPDEPVVVFCWFRDVVTKLAHKYDGVLVVGGEDTPIPRGAPRIFGTIGAMGTAQDLPWITTAIFLDESWSSIEMYQAKQRIDRIIIESARQIYYLTTTRRDGSPSVDDYVKEMYRHKLGQAETLRRFVEDVRTRYRK